MLKLPEKNTTFFKLFCTSIKISNIFTVTGNPKIVVSFMVKDNLTITFVAFVFD